MNTSAHGGTSCSPRSVRAIDIYLLTELDSKALILGLSWLGIGIVYLLVLTRGLTKEPPEMTAIAEAE